MWNSQDGSGVWQVHATIWSKPCISTSKRLKVHKSSQFIHPTVESLNLSDPNEMARTNKGTSAKLDHCETCGSVDNNNKKLQTSHAFQVPKNVDLVLSHDSRHPEALQKKTPASSVGQSPKGYTFYRTLFSPRATRQVLALSDLRLTDLDSNCDFEALLGRTHHRRINDLKSLAFSCEVVQFPFMPWVPVGLLQHDCYRYGSWF